MNRLTCDFNRSGDAFTAVDGSALAPCENEAYVVFVEGSAVVRACCWEHDDLTRDEHPDAVEYGVFPMVPAA